MKLKSYRENSIQKDPHFSLSGLLQDNQFEVLYEDEGNAPDGYHCIENFDAVLIDSITQKLNKNLPYNPYLFYYEVHIDTIDDIGYRFEVRKETNKASYHQDHHLEIFDMVKGEGLLAFDLAIDQFQFTLHQAREMVSKIALQYAHQLANKSLPLELLI